MDEDPRALYHRWLLELWHGEYAVAGHILQDDFTGHWPDRDVEGRKALVDLIRETRGMFDELAFRLELGPVVEGNTVAARWSGVGRSGEAEMPLLGHDLLTVRDGRFAEYWVVSWTG